MAGKKDTYEFVPLPLATRGWAKAGIMQYRIYKNADEFIVIEAERASRAVELSGVEKPWRVERIITQYEDMVAEEDMTEVLDKEDASELDILVRKNPVLTTRAVEDLLRKEEEAKSQQAEKGHSAPAALPKAD
ncbi:MAG: hypothetical protein IT567_06220 [Alphaproteobacteria bacterium]|nr:hypothetical protein [Alphaproteobacteria bacterium]